MTLPSSWKMFHHTVQYLRVFTYILSWRSGFYFKPK